MDPVMPFFLVGAGLLSLTLGLVFLWSRRTLAAERAARRAAEAQTAAKSAFIAMVSHELRTPINAILTGAESLERDRPDAALIADAGLMMRGLLNDLLDLSKIEAGRMSVEVVDNVDAIGGKLGPAPSQWQSLRPQRRAALHRTLRRSPHVPSHSSPHS